MPDSVNLAAEFAAPETVTTAAPESVNLVSEFEPPPSNERTAVINDAAGKAQAWKKATSGERLGMLLSTFGDHFSEETRKTLTQNWEDANKPMVGLPSLPEGSPIPIGSGGSINSSILAGAYNGIAPVLSSLTSPLSIGTLGAFGALTKVAQGAGPAAKAAQVGLKLVQGAFAGEMAKGAGEAAGSASVTDGKSVQEETADVVGALAQSAMAALAAHGAATPKPMEMQTIKPLSTEEKTPNANPITSPAQEIPVRPEIAPPSGEVAGGKPGEPVTPAGAAAPEVVQPEATQAPKETLKPTPALEFVGEQEGVGNIPNFKLYNLKEGIPGHPEGSTVTAETLAKEGFDVSKLPTEPPKLAEEFTPPASGTEEHAAIIEELAKPVTEAAPPEAPAPALDQEFTAPEGATSVKNAIVDQERKDRGLPAAMEPAAKEFGESWNAAIKKVEENPNAGADLVADVLERPRPLTDEENALLLHRQIEVQNQFDKVTERIANGDENASPEQRAADAAQLAKTSDELLDIYNAGKLVGTEQGRGLASRKMLANEDYSLAKMTTLRRAVNDGNALTLEQSAEVKDLHAKIDATQKAFDDYRAAQEERMKGLEKKRAGTSNTDRNVISRYIDKQADAARQRIKARYAEGRIQAGLDPADLADHALVGAQYIKNGLSDFGAWSVEMVKEFGDRVKPFLTQIFDKAKEGVDANVALAKLEARKKALEARIKVLERKVEEKDLTVTPPKASRPSVQEIEELEQRRDDLSEQLGRMREVHDKIEELKSAIAEKDRKITEGDLSAKPSAANRPSLPEIEKLKQDRDALNKQLEQTRKEERKSIDEEVAQAKLDELKEQIASKKEAIRTGNVSPERAELNRPQPKELEEALRERDELSKQIAEMRPPPETVHGNEPMTPEERRLSDFKSRAAINAGKYDAKTAASDFSPRPKAAPLALDEEALRLKAENERAKIAFQTALIKDRLANRTSLEKAQDTFVKWRRGFLLSGPGTLAKLTGAAALRVVTTPIEELTGAALGTIAPDLMARAPRHGGLNSDAEAKAITAIFTKGMRDAHNVLTTGKSNADVLFGRTPGGNVRPSDVIPQSMIDFFGNLHGALKAPVKASEFARSFEKRTAFAIRNGVDVSDPAVQQAISVAAYKDANRAIFMQDNVVSKAFNGGLAMLENMKTGEGKKSAAGKAISTAIRVMLPIVKVPTNIVAEAVEYATGSVTGSVKLAKAMREGMDGLTPEQADTIARQLKKGSIGAAALLIGYFGHKNFGGFYQQGEHRDKKDVAPGAARIGDTNIGRSLIHSSLVETMQLGATIGRYQEQKVKGVKNDLLDSVGLATLGLAEELPFVRTPIELGKLFDKNERQYVKGELVKGLVVPQAVSQAAQFLDTDAKGNPIRRNPKTVMEHVETGVPGIRETVRRK